MRGGRITLRLKFVSAALAMTVFFLSVRAEGPAAVETPQPLADALEAYAKASGYQLIYRSDLTTGLTTTAVPPNTPPVEALRQLLRGTDLLRTSVLIGYIFPQHSSNILLGSVGLLSV